LLKTKHDREIHSKHVLRAYCVQASVQRARDTSKIPILTELAFEWGERNDKHHKNSKS
jgi:hypothetical protein